MTLPSTIQPSEITAMLVALPVFLLWVRNYIQARKGLQAVRQREGPRLGNPTSGIRWQARDVAFSAFAMAIIELSVIGVLVMMMTFNPNPDSTLLSRWTIAGSTIIVSLMVGAIALVRKISGDQTLARMKSPAASRDPEVSQKDWSDWSGAE